MPNLPLADPSYHILGKVDVVIGGEAFWELHTGRKRSLGAVRPWLVETQIGWVAAGNAAQSSHPIRVCHIATSDPLEAIMTRFWGAETIFDEPALSHKSNPNVILEASKQIADRRLLAMERRLKGNPHHAVVKASSTTTKVRKTTSGYSLNDSLLVGPVVQQDYTPSCFDSGHMRLLSPRTLKRCTVRFVTMLRAANCNVWDRISAIPGHSHVTADRARSSEAVSSRGESGASRLLRG